VVLLRLDTPERAPKGALFLRRSLATGVFLGYDEVMKQAKVILLIGVVISAFVLAGCSSSAGRVTSKTTAGSPDDPFSLAVLSYQDVRALYGPTFLVNPYLAPSSSIMPVYNDYIVAQLIFNLPEKSKVILLRAEISDERGKIYASYMNREKFSTFAMQQSPEMANNALKQNKIDWYYLPNQIMDMPAGKHTYVIVMVGPHPIPDTATIHVAMSVNDQAISYDLSVPISTN
jgi:hypothetical protein